MDRSSRLDKAMEKAKAQALEEKTQRMPKKENIDKDAR
jgi:hypothetical protein